MTIIITGVVLVLVVLVLHQETYMLLN